MLLTRRTVLFLSAILALNWAGCAPDIAPENRLRVVNWNLEWFPGGKPDAPPEQQAAQMAAAKKAVAELQPDVLLVQEVRDWASTAELAKVIPGLNVHVVSEFHGRPQNQGIAAKLPADSAWAALWTAGPVEPPRGYAFAALQFPGDRFLLTYSLHLKSNLGDFAENVAMRRESARQLLAHAKEMLALYRQRGPTSVIIGGDLNTSLDDPKFAAERTLPALRLAGFHWTHEGVAFAKRTTIPADDQFPDNCFDHIYTLGLGRHTASVKAYQQISDHHPVVLDIDVTKIDFQGEIDFAAAEKDLGPPRRPEPPPTLVGTLNAVDDTAIRAAIGQIATVRGKVSKVDATASGSITFIDFEGTDRRKFTTIIRRERLADIGAQFGGDLKAAITGKVIEVSGKLQLYKNTPEIVLTKPDQLRIVPE